MVVVLWVVGRGPLVAEENLFFNGAGFLSTSAAVRGRSGCQDGRVLSTSRHRLYSDAEHLLVDQLLRPRLVAFLSRAQCEHVAVSPSEDAVIGKEDSTEDARQN